jgi:hypothetical protein
MDTALTILINCREPWGNEGLTKKQRIKVEASRQVWIQKGLELGLIGETKLEPIILKDNPSAEGYVYFIRQGDWVKIGYSANPHKRLSGLQTSNPKPLTLLKTIKADQSYEKHLHNQLMYANVRGEWFDYEKVTERIDLSE